MTQCKETCKKRAGNWEDGVGFFLLLQTLRRAGHVHRDPRAGAESDVTRVTSRCPRGQPYEYVLPMPARQRQRLSKPHVGPHPIWARGPPAPPRLGFSLQQDKKGK